MKKIISLVCILTMLTSSICFADIPKHNLETVINAALADNEVLLGLYAKEAMLDNQIKYAFNDIISNQIKSLKDQLALTIPSTRATIKAGIINLYINYLKLSKTIPLLESKLSSSKVDLNHKILLNKQKTLSTPDLEKVKALYSVEELELIKMKRNLDIITFNLNKQLGLDIFDKVEYEYALNIEVKDLSNLTLEKALASAFSNRSQIRIARSNLSSMQSIYNQTSNLPNIDIVDYQTSYKNLMEAKLKLANTETEIRNELTTLFNKYKASFIDIEIAEANLKIANNTYNQMLEYIKTGYITQDKLNQVNLSVHSAKIALETAKWDNISISYNLQVQTEIGGFTSEK